MKHTLARLLVLAVVMAGIHQARDAVALTISRPVRFDTSVAPGSAFSGDLTLFDTRLGTLTEVGLRYEVGGRQIVSFINLTPDDIIASIVEVRVPFLVDRLPAPTANIIGELAGEITFGPLRSGRDDLKQVSIIGSAVITLDTPGDLTAFTQTFPGEEERLFRVEYGAPQVIVRGEGDASAPFQGNSIDRGVLTVTYKFEEPAAVVPEPSTLLLLGSGLAGLAAWRRRKAA